MTRHFSKIFYVLFGLANMFVLAGDLIETSSETADGTLSAKANNLLQTALLKFPTDEPISILLAETLQSID